MALPFPLDVVCSRCVVVVLVVEVDVAAAAVAVVVVRARCCSDFQVVVSA